MKHSVFKQTACFIVFFTMMILIFYWICSVVITMPEAEPMTAVTKHVYVKNRDGNQQQQSCQQIKFKLFHNEVIFNFKFDK